MLRGLTLTLLFVLLLSALPASAEVSVRFDRQGEYVTTQVLSGSIFASERKIWTPRGRGGHRWNAVLNPYGDANGDLYPAVVESASTPHYPMVIWSGFNGLEYDLVWSRWSKHGWQPITWVAGSDGLGDDLDPDGVFDSQGRAYVVWWRDEPQGGRIYVSTLIGARWSTPCLVSDAEMDSRYPALTVEPDDTLTVRYETPEGPVTSLMVFSLPDTITDDINPQVMIKSSTEHVSQSKY